jgi:hypothetical protein
MSCGNVALKYRATLLKKSPLDLNSDSMSGVLSGVACLPKWEARKVYLRDYLPVQICRACTAARLFI